MKPQVRIIALSNVFTRSMHFVKRGDIEEGHCHTYDHATLVSIGSVLYEVLDGPAGNAVFSKIVQAPNLVYVDKDKYHRITSLEDDTVCACIHAIRTIDEDIVDPDFILEPIESQNRGELHRFVEKKTGKGMLPFTPNKYET